MKRTLWLINDLGQIETLGTRAEPSEHGLSLGRGIDLADLSKGQLPKRLGILISSVHCFWTKLPSKPSGNHTSFDLEELLPLDAEDIHFVQQTDRFGANVIAISTQHLLPLLAELEKNDVDIDFVAPWSVAQLDYLLKTQSIRSGRFVIASQSRFDLFEVDNRVIRSWQVAWATDDIKDKLSQLGDSLPIMVVDLDPKDLSPLDTKPLQWDPDVFIGTLETAKKPLVLGNLSHGKLESNQRKQAYQRSLWNTLVAVLLLLLTIAGISFFKADQEQQEAETMRSSQVRRLRKTFATIPRRDEGVWLNQQAADSRQALAWIEKQVHQGSLMLVLARVFEAIDTQPDESPLSLLALDRQQLRIEAEFKNAGQLEAQLQARSFSIENKGIVTTQQRSIVAFPTDTVATSSQESLQ